MMFGPCRVSTDDRGPWFDTLDADCRENKDSELSDATDPTGSVLTTERALILSKALTYLLNPVS